MPGSNRLIKELASLKKKPVEGCRSVELVDEDNVHEWVVVLEGPPSPSPYARGLFRVSLLFSEDYPFQAPTISFLTKIHHPNVKKETGEICTAVFSAGDGDGNWGPTLNVRHCLTVLRTILITPDADNPFEDAIAQQLRDRPKEFEEEAAKYTKEHAT